jgi:NDP-sugar pyrophosphorylase family protein
MRAVIVASGDGHEIAPLNARFPVPMLPLLDRPFLQHVVEYFARQGVNRFDFVLSHLPEKIEHHLGDGKRWGAEFTYHLARDPGRPYWLLKILDLQTQGGGPLLFGHADRLPPLTLTDFQARASGPPLLFGWHAGADRAGPLTWTGWALVAPEHLASLPNDADEAAVQAHLMASAPAQESWAEVGRPLMVSSFHKLLLAQRAVLDKEFTGLLLTGKENDEEPGVWLSRNVSWHPTVEPAHPLYVGENCEIGPNVKLGPHAVVGHGCILDRDCTVSNALIFPGSYVGQNLELVDVIVDRNHLINGRIEQAVRIDDQSIISTLEQPIMRPLSGFFSRVWALAMLALFSPVLLLTFVYLLLFRRGPAVYRKEVVRLPWDAQAGLRTYRLWSFEADDPPALRGGIRCRLRDVLLRFLPALVNVARGDVRFVGVPPRSPAEVELLSPEWRSHYLECKGGIVTEAAVRHGPHTTEEEVYAAEVCYAAIADWKYDLKLLCGYGMQVLMNTVLPGREQAT